MPRLQLELSDTHGDLVESLRATCGCSSKKEVVLSALALLAWAVREVSEGRRIASVGEDAGAVREIHHPAFDAPARDGETRRRVDATVAGPG